MKTLKTLLPLLAAATLLAAGVAQAEPLLDIAVVNNGTTTTFTIESTGAAATLPGALTSTTGSTGDGFDVMNLFAEGGIAPGGTYESSNAGGTGWANVFAPPTGTLAAGSSATYNAYFSDFYSTQVDNPDLDIVSTSTFASGANDQTFTNTGAAFTGTLTFVIPDGSEIANYYLPFIGDSGEIQTGWSGSTSGVTGAYGTPNVNIGTWQVVAFADLPSSLDNPPAAPEPRSWALAALVALAFLGLCHLRLRSLDKSESETPQLVS